MAADLVITGGTVVDGTGLPRDGAPTWASSTGGSRPSGSSIPRKVPASSARRPGRWWPRASSTRTHYDPQLTFEPYGTSSCFHGVTTVVAGNCGFSVAPLKPASALLIQLFARVEGMDAKLASRDPGRRVRAPRFLASMRGKIGISAAFYVGHCALRRYVMGRGSGARGHPRRDRADGRAGHRSDGGRSGWLQLHLAHFDSADRPVPSRLSSLDELKALTEAAGRAGGGSVAYLPGSAVGGIARGRRSCSSRCRCCRACR